LIRSLRFMWASLAVDGPAADRPGTSVGSPRSGWARSTSSNSARGHTPGGRTCHAN